MLWAIFSLGFLNYISFFYVARKVRQKKWFIAGLVYAALFVLLIVTFETFPEDHWFYNLVFGLFMLGWIVSIFHVFKIRPEYLLRLEAKQAAGQDELEELRRKIAREYGTKREKAEEQEQARRILEEQAGAGRLIAEQAQDGRLTGEQLQGSGIYEERPAEQASTEAPQSPVDINTASVEEIGRVPGIGSLMARKIVEVREKEGPFRSLDHFAEALSLKPHVMERIKPYVAFSGGSGDKPEQRPAGRLIDF